MIQSAKQSADPIPILLERLEARLLLSAALSLDEMQALGFRILETPVELSPGAWKVADGPSPDALAVVDLLNAEAADTTNAENLWGGGGLGLNLTGAGVTAGIWDGGRVRDTHQELTGRVTYNDGTPSAFDDHATHVAGTIGATGVWALAHGMAPGVAIRSYTLDNDHTELAADADLIDASNHSYGYLRGWTLALNWGAGIEDTWVADRLLPPNEDPLFGKYAPDPINPTGINIASPDQLDDVLHQNPHLLSVWAGGNDADDDYTNAADEQTYVTWFGVPIQAWVRVDTAVWPAPAGDGNSGTGYDSLPTTQVSKNSLVVGAVRDVLPDPHGIGDVVLTDYSSCGPTDDGRIKPDLVGDGGTNASGQMVLSSSSQGDDLYYLSFGTSMAAANVTGTSILVIEHYHNLHGGMPLAATTKAAAIHTAFDSGNTGPDYQFGWGLIDGAAAANFLTDAMEAVPSDWVMENTYTGTEWTWDLYSDGAGELKATVVWTDPAGAPVGPGLDDPTPVLVNDVDLWVTGPGGTYHPWTLDRLNPANPAVRTAANHVDNVEQVLIDAPAAGIYTIHVGHTGTAFTQDYSLLVSGAAERSATPTDVDLKPDYDTGAFNDDDLTKLDNHDAENVLQFDVLGTVAGATVTLYAGDTEIGSQTATGTTTTVTTDGTVELDDGGHDITARQTETGKLPSAPSPVLTVTIDATPPTVVEDGFLRGYQGEDDWKLRPTELWTISLVFSEDVVVDEEDALLDLDNLSQSGSIDPVQPTYDSQTFTATWDYGGITPDEGWYLVTLSMGVEDLAGNALDGDGDEIAGGDYVYGAAAPENDMLIPILGDADLDGEVGWTDYQTVRAHLGQSGQTWEDGDFNYDTWVNYGDYIILKQHIWQSVGR